MQACQLGLRVTVASAQVTNATKTPQAQEAVLRAESMNACRYACHSDTGKYVEGLGVVREGGGRRICERDEQCRDLQYGERLDNANAALLWYKKGAKAGCNYSVVSYGERLLEERGAEAVKRWRAAEAVGDKMATEGLRLYGVTRQKRHSSGVRTRSSIRLRNGWPLVMICVQNSVDSSSSSGHSNSMPGHSRESSFAVVEPPSINTMVFNGIHW